MDKVLFHLLNDLDGEEERRNLIEKLTDEFDDLSLDELKDLLEDEESK